MDPLPIDLVNVTLTTAELRLNIVRWIIASARKYFHTFSRYPMFYEHTGPKTLTLPNGRPITEYTEFRLDGPYTQQITKRETHYEIEINVLCVTTVDQGNADKIEDVLGSIHSIFSKGNFPVLRYGDSSIDDESHIGCMLLRTDKREEVRVSRFGQANPDTRVLQASVEGHYQMRLF